jgi:tripartite-type tricarboxylate transporter receptor subunit TctC
MNRRFVALVLAAGLLAASDSASSQHYPSKPVRLICGFPPGAAADAVSRILANALSRALGQPVLVENKPGAESAIAAAYVAKSAPDGYTILFGSSSNMVAAPALRREPPYDPTTDFTPLSLIGHGTFLLFSHPSVPATNLRELVDHLRANPDKLTYATGNPISIIATAQFMKATGTRMVQVPYKGEAPAIPDLVAGRVQVEFIATVAVALPHVNSGRLRVLAAMTDRRSPLVPDVPTLNELGVPDVTVRLWAALYGPAKMPAAVTTRLSSEINTLLTRPEVREQLVRQGYDPQGSSPEELGTYLKSQYALWKQAVKEAGVTLLD